MNEEARIEALENELKILKNEIQATLLEIREQILNHYYPELRAEEPMRSRSLPVRPTVGRPGVPAKSTRRSQELTPSLSELEAKGQIEPFADIFLEDLSVDEGEAEATDAHPLFNSRRPSSVILEEDDDYEDELDDAAFERIERSDDIGDSGRAHLKPVTTQPGNTPDGNPTNAAPRTREVNFRQMKDAATESAPVRKRVAKPVNAQTTSPKANRQTFAALATWVADSVSAVGKKRTRQIVDTYATGGKLTNETQNSLMQMISLADDEEPRTPVGNREMLPLMVELDNILA